MNYTAFGVGLSPTFSGCWPNVLLRSIGPTQGTVMKFIGVFGKLVVALLGAVMLAVGAALMIYPPEYVYRTLVWQGSDAFDWQKFPSHPLHAAPTPFLFDEAGPAR